MTDVTDCLKQYVKTVVKTFENKLSVYKNHSAPGVKPKMGKKFTEAKKLAEDVGPLSKIPGGRYATSKIVEKLSENTAGKDSREKAKTIYERLRSTKKDDLRKMLVQAAGEIFLNFEYQFMNVTDKDDFHMRALEKLAEDAVDRIMNYVNDHPYEDLDMDYLLVKAVLQGKSKDGHTIKMNQKTLKTGQLYEILVDQKSMIPEYKYKLSRVQLVTELDKILKDINKNDGDKMCGNVYESHEMITEIHQKLVKKDTKKLVGPFGFDVRAPVTSFTGRTKELEELHDILQNNGETVISQMASVSGLGGIGKSELARKYISLYNKDYDERIVWINAESYDSLTDSFKRLASNKLDIKLKTPDGEEKNINAIVEDVYKSFADGKCLFIFDNADKRKNDQDGDSGLHPFLPLFPLDFPKRVFVLITSRNRKWDKLSVLNLDIFSEEEAADFIRNDLGIPEGTREDEITQLAEKLQRFPLALQQAVAYIKVENETQRTLGSEYNIADYLKEYEEDTKTLLDFKFPGESENTYTKTVFTTWRITVRKIENKEAYGKLAKVILDMTAYLAADNIPVHIFIKSEMTDKEKHARSSAVGLLKQYSMISSGQDETLFNIHRLVQEVTRLELKDHDKEHEILLHLFILLYDINLDNSQEADLLKKNRKIMPHLEAYLLHLERRDKDLATYKAHLLQIVYILGIGYTTFGEHKRAKVLLEQALQIIEEFPSFESEMLPIKANILNHLALVVGDIGDREKEKELFIEATNILNQTNIQSPDMLINLSLAANDQKEEIALLERALEMQELQYGPFDFKLVQTIYYLTIAMNVSKLEHYERLKELLERIKIIQMRYCGSDDIHITPAGATNVSTMEELHRQAMEFYERVWIIQKKQMGPDHICTAQTIINLALSVGDRGDFKKQIELLEQAIRIQEKYYECYHYEVINAKCDIAYAFEKLGDFKRSEEILEEILVVQEKHYGPDHFTNARILQNLGNVKMALGKYDGVKELLEKALKIVEKYRGEDYHEVGRILNDLYKVKKHFKDLKNGKELLERALKIQEKSLGPDHDDVAETLVNLADVCHNLGDHMKAFIFLERARHIVGTTR